MTREHRARHLLHWLIILPLTLGALILALAARPRATDLGSARSVPTTTSTPITPP